MLCFNTRERDTMREIQWESEIKRKREINVERKRLRKKEIEVEVERKRLRKKEIEKERDWGWEKDKEREMQWEREKEREWDKDNYIET